MKRASSRSPQRAVTAAEKRRAAKFFQWLEERGRRPRTLAAYQGDWRVFAGWYHRTNDEPFDLTRLTALDLNDYREWALAENLAPSTINRRLGFLKQYAAWGMEQGMVEPSVHRAIKEVRSARQQKLAPRAIAQPEVRRLLKEVELRAGSRDQAIIYTLLFTGLRVGEIAHLEVEDVTLSERKGTIIIEGSMLRAANSARCRCRWQRAQGWRPIWIPIPSAKGRSFWASVAR